MTGGLLVVTNSGGTATFKVGANGRGTFTLIGGSIMADNFFANNGASSTFNFNGGTLNTRSTTVSNGSPFIVGNGTSSATLNLLGGTHSFANGLTISSNAVLSGKGSIQGGLTLAGTLAPGNSPGVVTNFGNLTMQSSGTLDMQLGGTAQGTEYDFMRDIGGTVTFDGMLRLSFIDGFQTNVLNSETFTLLTADSSLLGSFDNVLDGQRLMTADGFGSFLVNYGGPNLVLTDFQISSIPEPATLALLALGGWVLLRRRSCD
jgi:subtilase-type serine protease